MKLGRDIASIRRRFSGMVSFFFWSYGKDVEEEEKEDRYSRSGASRDRTGKKATDVTARKSEFRS